METSNKEIEILEDKLEELYKISEDLFSCLDCLSTFHRHGAVWQHIGINEKMNKFKKYKK